MAVAAAHEGMPGMDGMYMSPATPPAPNDARHTIDSPSTTLLTGLLAYLVSFLAVRGIA